METKDSGKRENRWVSMAKYSASAFQMLAIIAVFAFIGYKIDQYRETEKMLFTAILGLFGVIVSLYQIVKSVTRK